MIWYKIGLVLFTLYIIYIIFYLFYIKYPQNTRDAPVTSLWHSAASFWCGRPVTWLLAWWSDGTETSRCCDVLLLRKDPPQRPMQPTAHRHDPRDTRSGLQRWWMDGGGGSGGGRVYVRGGGCNSRRTERLENRQFLLACYHWWASWVLVSWLPGLPAAALTS